MTCILNISFLFLVRDSIILKALTLKRQGLSLELLLLRIRITTFSPSPVSHVLYLAMPAPPTRSSKLALYKSCNNNNNNNIVCLMHIILNEVVYVNSSVLTSMDMLNQLLLNSYYRIMMTIYSLKQAVETVPCIICGLRHWGPHAKVSWGPSLFLPSPSLSGSFLRPFLSPLPLPPVPSSAISLPSFYLFSFRSGHLNTAMGPGERCKLSQWGLGRSPSRQTIWCIFESKRAALLAAIFHRVTQEYR